MPLSPDEVTDKIAMLLVNIPSSDRIGFLFGMVVGMMRLEGYSDEKIRILIHSSLDLAFAKSEDDTEKEILQ
jgi:hypothetical protein